MPMTKSEVLTLLQSSIRYTANKLRIADPDWKAPRELLEEIKAVDYETYNLLVTFIRAYVSWYNNKNQKNILRRNETREGILNRLQSL